MFYQKFTAKPTGKRILKIG